MPNSLITSQAGPNSPGGAGGYGRVTFYYKNSLSGLAATSTDTGFDVSNLYNMFEHTRWKASSTADQFITFSPSTPYLADYVAINGHNFFSTGATFSLQYSSDNFSADINDAFTPFTPTSNNSFVKTFDAIGADFWRIAIAGAPSSAAQMSIAIWGEKTELDYVNAAFDPNRRIVRANRNISQTGFYVGNHQKYTERRMSLRFVDSELDIYEKVSEWFDTTNLNNFFVHWDPDGHPDELYLMRSEPEANDVLTKGGIYRTIRINLSGRAE